MDLRCMLTAGTFTVKCPCYIAITVGLRFMRVVIDRQTEVVIEIVS